MTRALAALVMLLAPLAPMAQSIVVSPAVVELSGRAGQAVTQVVTLRNESTLDLEFTLEARDVVVRGGKRVFIEAGQLPDSIAATAVFAPKSLLVPGRSSRSVTMMLTLPPTVRHRAVVAHFRGTTVVQSGGRRTRLSIGTLFTFSLGEASLKAATLEARPPTAEANAQLRARMSNDGTEPVVPSGTAMIMDAGGRALGKAVFRPSRLLPGEEAVLVADYGGDLAAGSYRVIATFDIAGKPLNLSAPLVVR